MRLIIFVWYLLLSNIIVLKKVNFNLEILKSNNVVSAKDTAVTKGESHDADNSPNIVFIMTDNQGAWSLGSYGNPDIQTPHIDHLAEEGTMFTRAMSSNPVCSPTRATFFTGLIPSQHGVHTYIDNKYMMGPEATNLVSELTTLPEVLQNAGYTNGLSGKWHLGDHSEPAKGFSYWVVKPGGHTTGFYNQEVIEDGKVHTEEGYTTDFWTQKGIEFIEQNKDKDRPFFLALTYNGPYGLSDLMLRSAKNRWGQYYENHHFQSFVSDRMHPWQQSWKQIHNKQSAMERYASELSGVDDGVGKILSTLKRYGLESNTLVIFTADQGYMGGQNGIWGMGDHTRPIGALDLMMNIPLIFYQPGHVPSGRESDIIVSNYDFMPTLLSYLGIDWERNNDLNSPGRDFSPLLEKDTKSRSFSWNNEMFYEMENTRAIRTDNWKYVARYPDGPYELYNVTIDPQERFNMYGQPDSEEKVAELSARLDEFFAKYANPKYDLWNGGKSKVHRITSDSINYTRNYFKAE